MRKEISVLNIFHLRKSSNFKFRHFVEIIHTNGGTLGMREALGHADFYPNFGRSQPGCGIDLVGSCAHSRAYIFYAESINNNGFLANQCESFNEVNNGRCPIISSGHRMGGDPPNSDLRGYFHLTTNSAAPFAQWWSWEELKEKLFIQFGWKL